MAGSASPRDAHAAAAGVFGSARGMRVARIADHPIVAPIPGTLRGMLRNGIAVAVRDKLCEVDPRPAHLAVFTGIGQRPAGIAAGVARAIGVTPLHGSGLVPSEAVHPEATVCFTPSQENRP